jgi:high-affinity nickel-transport protein
LTYLALTLAAAIVLGMRHATDADHVVAVTSIVSRERSLGRASWVGVLWGLGHSATILLVGGAIVVLRVVLPARITTGFEIVVALMLVVLGVRSLLGMKHEHAPLPLPPFVVGVVHGLAGSAAAALLIVPLIPDPLWALLYLFVFGMGTIVGMMAITSIIAGSTIYATARMARLDRWIRAGAGVASLTFGTVLLVRLA